MLALVSCYTTANSSFSSQSKANTSSSSLDIEQYVASQNTAHLGKQQLCCDIPACELIANKESEYIVNKSLSFWDNVPVAEVTFVGGKIPFYMHA